MRRFELWLLHAALIIIAVGAVVTWRCGLYGSLYLRQGLPENEFVLDSRHVVRMPFTLTLDSFRVECYKDSPMPCDYVSWLTIDGQPASPISINHPLAVRGCRFYQMGYDSDCRGVTLAVNRDPWGRALVYAGYIAALIALILLTLRRYRLLPPLARILLPALLLVITALVAWSWSDPQKLPVLNSHWLLAHVTTIMTAYALFLFLAILQLAPRTYRRHTPHILAIAVTLLAAGIILGSVWADESWGRYWSWDPKETCALITLIIYAAPLHPRLFPRAAITRPYLIAALASILMTYYGVNHLLGGLHAYN